MPYKCQNFQDNEESFTFHTFKAEVSIKWKLVYSKQQFLFEVRFFFSSKKGH